eukprot:CAMPEP_0172025066 /NCGR_PEP_ID=MMETSP1041-20130122/15691_1 /TAXON_ID=464988 /ORGANISM="Hemiselmis andersenii, Strain CCMP439" /LENGTH=76 /DNA_ID=CAMNT_0012680721 /DNA_START=252 /DNA_END=479 /DNA_ORIENTATION=-
MSVPLRPRDQAAQRPPPHLGPVPHEAVHGVCHGPQLLLCGLVPPGPAFEGVCENGVFGVPLHRVHQPHEHPQPPRA